MPSDGSTMPVTRSPSDEHRETSSSPTDARCVRNEIAEQVRKQLRAERERICETPRGQWYTEGKRRGLEVALAIIVGGAGR